MKRLLLSLFIMTLSTALNAKETDKIRLKEVGLTFYNLDGFGITYRISNEKAVWRFNTAFSNGNQSFVQFQTNTNFTFGVNAGREWRKMLSEKLDFRLGFDMQYIYQSSISKNDLSSPGNDDKSISHTGGVNLVLGFNYAISKSIYLGAEVLPYIRSTNTIYTGSRLYTDQFGNSFLESYEREINNDSFGLQNNSALVSIIYRF